MSLLAPLYALAALAVALPIVFHLIQRRPRGRVDFSSLMFLTPSPPRLTRRSRLTNIWLLVLRVAALILLAIAFARPFLRSFTTLTTELPARRQVVLLDTSASMRRDGISSAVASEVDAILSDLQSSDEIAVMAFDRKTRTLFDWQHSVGLTPAQRESAIRSLIEHTTPSWHSTDLGAALVASAELLRDAAQSSDPSNLRQTITVISDLQQGASIDAISKYQWPSDIQVDLRRVACYKLTNAGAGFVTSSDDEQPDGNDSPDGHSTALRLRITNALDSTNSDFRLNWVARDGNIVDGQEQSVQVPPGATRVINVTRPSPDLAELRISGDDHSFDNSVFTAATERQTCRVLYVGPEVNSVSPNLGFYLTNAVLETDRHHFSFERLAPDAPLLATDPRQLPLIIINDILPANSVSAMKSYASQGGHLLIVITAEIATEPNVVHLQEMLQSLTSATGVSLIEAKVADYAMLTDIDYRHPIFQPFNDPRFSDFTKVRIWRHRRLSATDETPWRVAARFDDDRSPAWVDESIGNGRLTIVPFGWHGEESQFALSTKFIPILTSAITAYGLQNSLIGPTELGSELPFPNLEPSTYAVLPSGEQLHPTPTNPSLLVDKPGLYQWVDRGISTPIAVNIDYRESNTTPLDITTLEAKGLKIGRNLTNAEAAAQLRNMRDLEIEGQQQLWRWLLIAVLILLAIETWLASRLQMSPRVELAT